MARKVIWAEAAEQDLDAAAAYVHRDSPSYAVSFVHRVLQAGRSLSDFAERGRIVPEFKDTKIREVFVHSYRLIYRIEDEQVLIVALIHGRRDFRTAWEESER
ncbi:MAG: type II toxin-antitoxin system RelE/ParE family toxin [Deltaproteobacteria bacterium]|nr:type II toxin-antitoxin system RelE/ParE family toxin [Deltaproteobacteria bacterium]